MGLPMVQVVMIMARQMSKPVADIIMRYGKNHPLFRNKVLVPVGRGIVNLTTRLRMSNLGLGKPTSLSQVSESAALEQASEFVQQVVIFGYTVGVFYAYQVYIKAYEVPRVSKNEFDKLQEELNSQILQLTDRVEKLSDEIRRFNETKNGGGKGWSLFGSSKRDESAPQVSSTPSSSTSLSSSSQAEVSQSKRPSSSGTMSSENSRATSKTPSVSMNSHIVTPAVKPVATSKETLTRQEAIHRISRTLPSSPSSPAPTSVTDLTLISDGD